MTYLELVEQLVRDGHLETPEIIEAFRKINRADFLTEEFKNQAGINSPLPIGFGQTISQPLTVTFMLELLQPKAEERILDVGFGSGWQTSILAYIVSGDRNSKSQILSPREISRRETNSKQIQNLNFPNPKQQLGKVFAIERIKELMEFGKQNIMKYNFIKKGIVEIKCVDGALGWPEEAPFDKIIAAASGEKIPQTWKKQLKVGGRMVVPIKESIWLLVKESEKKFKEEEYPGFVFVPLITENR